MEVVGVVEIQLLLPHQINASTWTGVCGGEEKGVQSADDDFKIIYAPCVVVEGECGCDGYDDDDDDDDDDGDGDDDDDDGDDNDDDDDDDDDDNHHHYTQVRARAWW